MATQMRHEDSPSPKKPAVQPRIEDVNAYCSEMLSEMESEFNDVGNSILSRMNEMGKRMDDLESSISDLMNQAGLGLEGPEKDTMASPKGSPSNASKDNNTNSAVL